MKNGKYIENNIIYYYKEGKRHRDDGPAIEHADGTKQWYKEDKCHREDGPAIEHANGNKHWYKEGQYHRLDGPAVEYANGDKYWYYNGNPIDCSSQEEFEKLLKLKAFW